MNIIRYIKINDIDICFCYYVYYINVINIMYLCILLFKNKEIINV